MRRSYDPKVSACSKRTFFHVGCRSVLRRELAAEPISLHLSVSRPSTFSTIEILIVVASLPETAAEAYRTIRAEQELKGVMIGNNDLWIAAHALFSGLMLVTNNESEF